MTRTLIEVRGLTKSYGKQLVFQDLNLAIQEHSLTTIYGPSGVGKTTLLKIMGD
ncbi:ATP-binding cassette domain-containing protein [Ligilactobacillus agilis]